MACAAGIDPIGWMVMMFNVAIVRVMIVVIMVMMARIFLIAVLVEMRAILVGLNVNMGHAIARMAVPDSQAELWCCRGIQKQAVPGPCDPENAAPAKSRFNPGSQSSLITCSLGPPVAHRVT